jgi:3-oxoacyl-[acyl-carrier protein] reductase
MEGRSVTQHESGGIRRVALVMAASKGLGGGSAEALAQSGHALVICSRNREDLEEAAARYRTHGVPVEAVPTDVGKAEEIEAVFRRADETFGRLDVLVANAGGPPPGSFMDVTEEQWQIAYQLTLMSAVRAMRFAVPRMRANNFGRIVVIGSSSVKDPIPNLALSNAFRPALYGCVKTLSQEVGRDGITVNLVSPGRIDTDRVRSLDATRGKARGLSPEEVRAEYQQNIPVGRYGEPADLGALVGFLASEAAGYITGQSILVDGGLVSAL